MRNSASILGPRPAVQGDSLRHAYRPASHDELARMLASHRCRGCGQADQGSRGAFGTEPRSHQLGPVLFCTIDHHCRCGLASCVFVVFNDVLREAEDPCMSAEQALAAIEPELPPEALEQGLATIGRLLHRGEVSEAVAVAEQLVQRYPDRPECHYDAGCARQQLGEVRHALEHYRRALALHPQLHDAWRNRGLLLQRLGRASEARFCFSRARMAAGRSTPTPADAPPRVLAQVAGTFGTVRVLEDDLLRALYIDQQCQGAAYHDSDDDDGSPGRFAYSPYTTGWWLAACRHPRGHGLMLGLGSGAGAITLLTSFPELRLTVVEIDPRVTELALRFFPRLQQLRRSGRLQLRLGDAREVLRSDADGRYDFALVDLFSGSVQPPSVLAEEGFVAELASRAPLLLTNAIFTLGSDEARPWLSPFEAAGHPITHLYPVGDPETWTTRPHNWILATADVQPPAGSVPSSSSHYLAEALRNDLHAMVTRAIEVPVGVTTVEAPSEPDPHAVAP